MLEDYVAAGGCLISSGQTGLWNADSTLREQSSLHRLLGCGPAKIHREFATNRWSAYLRPALSHSFTGLLSCTTPPVSEYFMETAPLENSNGTEADSPVSEMLHFDLPCGALRPVNKQIIRHFFTGILRRGMYFIWHLTFLRWLVRKNIITQTICLPICWQNPLYIRLCATGQIHQI